MDLKKVVSEIHDFPKPGILFRDISPLLTNPNNWREVIERLSKEFVQIKPDIIVGIESRGFIVGSSLAYKMGVGFVPIRKKGKLPPEVLGIDYQLEYGTDTLEINNQAFTNKDRVLIVDDLLATGGTAKAAADLVERAGGVLVGFGFIIELTNLSGRDRLSYEVPVVSLLQYD